MAQVFFKIIKQLLEHFIRHRVANAVQVLDINSNNIGAQSTTAGREEKECLSRGGEPCGPRESTCIICDLQQAFFGPGWFVRKGRGEQGGDSKVSC